MNRIVIDRYPTADMHKGLDEVGEVRVAIEAHSDKHVAGEAEGALGGLPAPLSAYKYLRKARFSSGDEVENHVRGLREERDHRDR